MTNKARIILIAAGLGLGVALVFNVVHIASGGAWVASVPAAVAAGFGGRSLYWRLIARMTNSGAVVATEHGFDGRIGAIEVFWRPG